MSPQTGGTLSEEVTDHCTKTKHPCSYGSLRHEQRCARTGRINQLRLALRSKVLGVHLAHCVPDDQLLTLLDSFVKNGLLYWIEILSYIGELRGGLEMLENLIPFIAVSTMTTEGNNLLNTLKATMPRHRRFSRVTKGGPEISYA